VLPTPNNAFPHNQTAKARRLLHSEERRAFLHPARWLSLSKPRPDLLVLDSLYRYPAIAYADYGITELGYFYGMGRDYHCEMKSVI
jgi:hypothetical protein